MRTVCVIMHNILVVEEMLIASTTKSGTSKLSRLNGKVSNNFSMCIMKFIIGNSQPTSK
jgi:hypothetical protein